MQDVLTSPEVDLTGIPPAYFLLGLLSAFENRFQAVADRVLGQISWKQFFAIICINMCQEPPTVKDLAAIMGSSHQNVKQLLLKLEKKGFVTITSDEADRRKQRIRLTAACLAFCQENEGVAAGIMETMFAGVSQEQLQTTIDTLIHIGNQLSEV